MTKNMKKILDAEKQETKKKKMPAPEQTMKAIDIVQGLQLIACKSIGPSKLNYRKRFNVQAIAELTESVRSKGVLQPILVRPDSSNTFEIVTGFRRHLASKNAGIEFIPCIVRDLSDEDALEIQIIENDQREDPNPIDQAEGYNRLIQMGKHTPETLADKLHKSIPYVIGRLKLAGLSDDAKEALIEEKIAIGHAFIILRLGDEKEQAELLKQIIEHELTVSMAKDSLDDFSKRINKAVFDATECMTCPYCSSNQAVLFPELEKADAECMDRSCFLSKEKKHYEVIINEARKKGFKVILDKKEVDKLTSYSAKTSKEIRCPSANMKKQNYYGSAVIPKRYKSECMLCTTHHAYFVYEEKADYQGFIELKFGEICLNKSCLNAMNSPKNGSSPDDNGDFSGVGDSRSSTGNNAWFKAQECRNRFLVKTLSPIISESDTLQKRLQVLVLLNKLCYCDVKKRIVNDFGGKYVSHFSLEKEYNYAKAIAPGSLDDAIRELTLVLIPETNPEALLGMTAEAGIDMTKDFGVDEEWLKGNTKDQLTRFAKDQMLNIAPASPSSPKSKIIEEILKHDLRGKLPQEIIDACTIDSEDDLEEIEELETAEK
ncbi:MAG: ParB/RepB/Spo0J family partition protein [Thermodesulfovibrionales bacterium]|jgi:ParB family chromosome partitioning protein